MPRAKKRTAESMISKLRKAEVEISKGHATAQAANFSIPEEAMAEIEG